MGDVTRVLCGLGEFEVTGAVESAGGLEVAVRVCAPRCGVSALWSVLLAGQGVSHPAGARRFEL